MSLDIYSLRFIQSPQSGKANGSRDKDAKFIDPPAVACLQIRGDDRSRRSDVSPPFFTILSLFREEPDGSLRNVSQLMDGAFCESNNALRPDGKTSASAIDGTFFCWPKIYIREPGRYRLKASLFENRVMPSTDSFPSEGAVCVQYAMTGPFQVIDSRTWKQPTQTKLSHYMSRHGFKNIGGPKPKLPMDANRSESEYPEIAKLVQSVMNAEIRPCQAFTAEFPTLQYASTATTSYVLPLSAPQAANTAPSYLSSRRLATRDQEPERPRSATDWNLHNLQPSPYQNVYRPYSAISHDYSLHGDERRLSDTTVASSGEQERQYEARRSSSTVIPRSVPNDPYPRTGEIVSAYLETRARTRRPRSISPNPSEPVYRDRVYESESHDSHMSSNSPPEMREPNLSTILAHSNYPPVSSSMVGPSLTAYSVITSSANETVRPQEFDRPSLGGSIISSRFLPPPETSGPRRRP